MLGGSVVKLSGKEAADLRKKANLRFVVASDGHFGEQNTTFDTYYQSLVENITNYHQKNAVEFCVINGDKEIMTESAMRIGRKCGACPLIMKYA
jgi:hypothetical protein